MAARLQRESLINDGLAAVIVTIMLIPQSLAYALLAGLPAEMGLYASILPLIAYALFGSSRTLSVGPVAVASLMTASAVGAIHLRVWWTTPVPPCSPCLVVDVDRNGAAEIWFRLPFSLSPSGVWVYYCLRHHRAGAVGPPARCHTHGATLPSLAMTSLHS